MKLRIKGNAVRIRLSKVEVDELAGGSMLQDNTNFGGNSFGYAVKPVNGNDQLTASYDNNIITLYVPETLLKDWSTNSVTGFKNISGHLHLLLEKDFKCLDKTIEDQSGFFDNPAKSC